ncbi:hypothetical protein CEXT_409861 [Caerostris extrusa]|uniref:Uncharacterized protein n=1 Tax=Caerostris extrusa TaxID=172846 RepID=A0AAV4XJC4_CAEEX|nr:hypothetical protein CEXT_409861 [Caerostris extrusa]
MIVGFCGVCSSPLRTPLEELLMKCVECLGTTGGFENCFHSSISSSSLEPRHAPHPFQCPSLPPTLPPFSSRENWRRESYTHFPGIGGNLYMVDFHHPKRMRMVWRRRIVGG